MVNLRVETYLTADDYKNKRFYIANIIVSKEDVIRHTMTLGNISDYSTSKKGLRFYREFVKMFFDGQLNVRQDYEKSESSLMSSYSFLMGMIFTRVIAEKKHNITNLFHLKGIQYKQISGNSHPDFFGYKEYTGVKRPYLFEAKGRSKNQISRGQEIDDAKNQLLNINILDEADHLKHDNSEMQKHIVNTIFLPRLRILDIDPPSGENKKKPLNLKLSHYQLIVKYYQNIFKILQESNRNEVSVNGHKYIVMIDNLYSIGIRKDTYSLLEELSMVSSHQEAERYIKKHYLILDNAIHNNFNEGEGEKRLDLENYSIGKDGVIYISNEKNIL